MASRMQKSLKVETDDDGRVDTIFLGDWLQVEHMGSGCYDVHVGPYQFGVSRLGGRLRVNLLEVRDDGRAVLPPKKKRTDALRGRG